MEKLEFNQNGQWSLVKARVDEGKSDSMKRKARAERRGKDKMTEEEIRNAEHEGTAQSDETKWRKPKSGEIPSKKTKAFSEKQQQVANETGSVKYMPKKGKAFMHTTGVSDKGHTPRHKHAEKMRNKVKEDVSRMKWYIQSVTEEAEARDPKSANLSPRRVLH